MIPCSEFSLHIILDTSPLPLSVIVLVNAFPKEVSHGCPARRHIWYTRSQTCFTREKNDRSRAAVLRKKGGKGDVQLTSKQGLLSDTTNQSPVWTFTLFFFLLQTNKEDQEGPCYFLLFYNYKAFYFYFYISEFSIFIKGA